MPVVFVCLSTLLFALRTPEKKEQIEDGLFGFASNTHAPTTTHAYTFSPHWKTIMPLFYTTQKSLQIQKMLKKDLSLFPSLYIHIYGAEFRISGRVPSELLGMDRLYCIYMSMIIIVYLGRS
jgi:hypothetical protein